MSKFTVAASLLLVIFLSSCVTTSKSAWQVKTGNRSTLAFTGKGAAAGVMMDIYMNGVGAAIGIAIDEGIAKTINENLQSKYSDFNVSTLVNQQLTKQSRKSQKLVCSEGIMQVVIDTYGFQTFPGKGDDVTAWLKMRFTCNGKDTLINYPVDFPAPKLAELNTVKTNPEIAYGLLQDAIGEVVQVWDKGLK